MEASRVVVSPLAGKIAKADDVETPFLSRLLTDMSLLDGYALGRIFGSPRLEQKPGTPPRP